MNLDQNQQPNENEPMSGKQIIALILLSVILSALLTGFGKAEAEETAYITAPTATPEAAATTEPVSEPANEPVAEPTSTSKPQKKKTRSPTLYEVPQELLDADPAFAAIMAEANKYVGYPYVWGGSNPRTSFDCSGFVSWVFTETGVSRTGRKGATGLYKLCTEVAAEDARPGDLVFFKGTMGPDVPGITHVGIYVGNGWMIHCGDPIGYADLTQGKWPKRFLTFGRLPYEGGYADVPED